MTVDATDFFADDKTPEPPQEEAPAPSYNAPPERQREARKPVPDLTLEAGLPANIDAEKTILGAILLDQRAIKETALTLTPDDFSLDSHRRIYLRMAELEEDGQTIDIVTLCARLSKFKEVESIGGVAYLASLTEGLPRRPVIDAYIRICKDKSIARRLMGICSATIARAADQSEDAISTLESLERETESLRESSRALIRNPEPFFIGARTFIASAPEQIEWTVDGIIQKEGNGLILGDSGTSKSVLIFDLALHLVSGVAWFQHRIPKRVKVGLVAREDAPGLSQSRLKRMLNGADIGVKEFIGMIDLEEYLYVNTRSQRESWTLQSNPDLVDIIENIKERQIEFVFFDVFRSLWEGNENDNQETSRVLAAAKRIEREGKCQVCIVHHLSKSEKGTIFDRARGGGINGWKEWGMGLTVENPEVEPKNLIRKVQFHTKSSVACPPIYYRIVGGEDDLSLQQVDNAPIQQPQYGHGKKKKKEGPEQAKMNYSQTKEPDEEAPF
jgi:hypothetical protein